MIFPKARNCGARGRRSLALLDALIALCSAGVILTGCVANRAYRDRDSRPWAKGSQIDFVQGRQLDQYEPFTDAEVPSHHFDLSYVEFDEKGDYWDRRQLGWTVQEIKQVARANDLVLIVYVHGWQNNASDVRGHDVGKFHCLLEHLSVADQGKHRFFGVYVAWRGKSVPGGEGVFKDGSIPDLISKLIFFVPHELSLWGRKNTAARVAGLPVTETIFQCVAAARSAPKSRTILIGHSFGALVLEKAMAQAIAAKVVSEVPKKGGTFTTPADFVVLLNSAAESIYAKEMIDFFRRRRPASVNGHAKDEISSEHPLMVSITSKADSATGMLFPIGTGLSNALGNFRKYEWDTKYGESSHNVSQREYFIHTPGHNDRLLSYEAKVVAGVPTQPIYRDTDECHDEIVSAFQRNLESPSTGPKGEIRFITLTSSGEETQWELRPRVEDKLQTPYWIIKVPKEIIRDHSDIFNENALALMVRLFRVSNPAAEPGIVTTAIARTMRLSDPSEQVHSTSPAPSYDH
jgi:hypothetical protein